MKNVHAFVAILVELKTSGFTAVFQHFRAGPQFHHSKPIENACLRSERLIGGGAHQKLTNVLVFMTTFAFAVPVDFYSARPNAR